MFDINILKMKLTFMVLTFAGGLSMDYSSANDRCHEQDLNTLMVRLHQLRGEFKQLKDNYEKQKNNTLKEFSILNHAAKQNAMEIQQLNATIQNRSTLIEDRGNEIERLKGLVAVKQITPLVTFVVRKLSGPYSCNAKLPFETIVLNEGNAFNTTTSYFKAPYSGLYALTTQLCAQQLYFGFTDFDFSIKSNTYNKTYGASRKGLSTDDDCNSLSTVPKLASDEEVYVRVDCQLTEAFNGDIAWTMFSGVLLHLSP